MTNPTGLQWRVLYTRPKLEKKVSSMIAELGYDTYLPLHTVVRKWSDRKKKSQVPLFPNYVFVRTSVPGCETLYSINGIVRFVSIDRRPVIIREEEISKIKKIITGDVTVSPEEYFQQGLRVRISHGQFSGLEGLVVKQNNKSRLIIKIDGIMKAFSLNVSPKELEVLL